MLKNPKSNLVILFFHMTVEMPDNPDITYKIMNYGINRDYLHDTFNFPLITPIHGGTYLWFSSDNKLLGDRIKYGSKIACRINSFCSIPTWWHFGRMYQKVVNNNHNITGGMWGAGSFTNGDQLYGQCFGIIK